MSIRAVNISKEYGDRKVLKDISFEIQEGQVVGLLGLNGAGKSTLMKIMSGFMPPLSGEIYLYDTPIEYTKSNFKKNIGYLPDRNPLYPDMYIREYLQFCAAFYNVPKSRVDEVIAQTAIEKELSKKIKTLSKGYLQRVGIAATIIHKPKILILDEPTSGIDFDQLIIVRQLIKELAKTSIIILSTHIMEEVKAVCNRILVLKNGHIVVNQDSNDVDQEFIIKEMKSTG